MKAHIKENVALAPFTTFRIGGPARYFIEASTEEIVLDAIQFAKENKLPVFVLGGGSNLLVADEGFPGLVIKIGITGVEWERDNDRTIVSAGAGEDWDRLVELNVTEQVQNLAKTSIVQRAWHDERRPMLHGWVYDLRTGYLKELACMPPGAEIDDIYRFEYDQKLAANGCFTGD